MVSISSTYRNLCGMVDDAYNAVKDCVAQGGKILFVGTKKQAQDSIQAEAERCGMFYVKPEMVRWNDD